MKSLVHLQDDESNLWLPAFQTFGLREGNFSIFEALG